MFSSSATILQSVCEDKPKETVLVRASRSSCTSYIYYFL